MGSFLLWQIDMQLSTCNLLLANDQLPNQRNRSFKVDFRWKTGLFTIENKHATFLKKDHFTAVLAENSRFSRKRKFLKLKFQTIILIEIAPFPLLQTYMQLSTCNLQHLTSTKDLQGTPQKKRGIPCRSNNRLQTLTAHCN